MILEGWKTPHVTYRLGLSWGRLLLSIPQSEDLLGILSIFPPASIQRECSGSPFVWPPLGTSSLSKLMISVEFILLPLLHCLLKCKYFLFAGLSAVVMGTLTTKAVEANTAISSLPLFFPPPYWLNEGQRQLSCQGSTYCMLSFLLLYMWQIMTKLMKIRTKYLSIIKFKVDKNQYYEYDGYTDLTNL